MAKLRILAVFTPSDNADARRIIAELRANYPGRTLRVAYGNAGNGIDDLAPSVKGRIIGG